MSTIYVSREGLQIGNWSETEVRDFFKEGKLISTDLYWKEDMTDWESLESLIQAPIPSSENSSPQRSSPTRREADAPSLLMRIKNEGIGRVAYLLSIVLTIVITYSITLGLVFAGIFSVNEAMITFGSFEVVFWAIITVLRLRNIGHEGGYLWGLTLLSFVPLFGCITVIMCLFKPFDAANR